MIQRYSWIAFYSFIQFGNKLNNPIINIRRNQNVCHNENITVKIDFFIHYYTYYLLIHIIY